MSPKNFDFELVNQVGHVILNRPDRLNALTFESYAELRDFFFELRTRSDVRAIVIRSEGRAFCSGGDVEDIIGELFSRDMRGLLEFTRMTGALIENIRRAP
jgi:enoyl-CoA hydratase/carnithine racemase